MTLKEEKGFRKKLVELKEVDQKVRYTSETCQKVIDLLTAKQDMPKFEEKCEQIIALFESKNGQRK